MKLLNKLNVLSMVGAILITGTASAKSTSLLRCTSVGDALGLVEVVHVQDVQNGKPLVRLELRIGNESDGEAPDTILRVKDSDRADLIKRLSTKKAAAILAAKDWENSFGGGVADAAYLTVDSQHRKGILAERGYIYDLNCGIK